LRITTLTQIGLVIVACLIGVHPTVLAAAARMAIIRFQFNAAQNYTFVQKGIVDMLTA
jgi:hypothetical protein